MSAFVLKMIAMITMFIDHLGYVVHNGSISWFNYIGRFAFPIFAFQISEGYIHTKDLKKYFFRLFLLAIISEIPYDVNKAMLVNKIDSIRIDKKIDGISEVRDESDREESVRIVIDLKKDLFFV